MNPPSTVCRAASGIHVMTTGLVWYCRPMALWFVGANAVERYQLCGEMLRQRICIFLGTIETCLWPCSTLPRRRDEAIKLVVFSVKAFAGDRRCIAKQRNGFFQIRSWVRWNFQGQGFGLGHSTLQLDLSSSFHPASKTGVNLWDIRCQIWSWWCCRTSRGLRRQRLWWCPARVFLTMCWFPTYQRSLKCQLAVANSQEEAILHHQNVYECTLSSLRHQYMT